MAFCDAYTYEVHCGCNYELQSVLSDGFCITVTSLCFETMHHFFDEKIVEKLTLKFFAKTAAELHCTLSGIYTSKINIGAESWL